MLGRLIPAVPGCGRHRQSCAPWQGAQEMQLFSFLSFTNFQRLTKLCQSYSSASSNSEFETHHIFLLFQLRLQPLNPHLMFLQNVLFTFLPPCFSICTYPAQNAPCSSCATFLILQPVKGQAQRPPHPSGCLFIIHCSSKSQD